jgi:hypothetical protein
MVTPATPGSMTSRTTRSNRSVRTRSKAAYTSAEWNRVELEEGRFETRLFRIVPELQFSPSVSWVNNVQYDTQSAVLGWQSRFRWIVKPGSDLYFVYTKRTR